MARLGSVLELLRFAPVVVETIRTARAKSVDEERIEENRVAVEDVRKLLEHRLEELEGEYGRLRARIKDMESTLTIYQVWTYVSAGAAVVALALALLAMVIHR